MEFEGDTDKRQVNFSCPVSSLKTGPSVRGKPFERLRANGVCLFNDIDEMRHQQTIEENVSLPVSDGSYSL
jgi:hypothetical protein